MKFNKLTSIILIAMFVLSILSIPTSALGISSAQELKPMQFVSINNSSNDAKDYYFKVAVKYECSLSFYLKSGAYNTKTTLNVLNKENLTIKNLFFAKNIEDGCYIRKKGTYYLQITLQSGQYINGFGYYFNNYNKTDSANITMIKGEKSNLNFINQVTKNKLRWKSLDKTIAKVSSSGTVTALKEGETRIFGYSDQDEYIDIKLNIIDNTKKANTVIIAGNEYRTNVKELDLQGMTLTKNDMKKLANFKNLETIYLMWCRIEDLSPIGKVTSLKDIGLGQSYISDISGLSTLVNLEAASLECNNITDVKPLKNLKKLKSLVLSGNDIKDYTPLKSLTNLKSLNIYNVNGVPEDQVAVLKKALPNCDIFYKI